MTSTQTTANPTVKVARDLTEISLCLRELRAQAIANASDPNIPGGPAMIALGPVADLETWANLNDTTAAYQDHPIEHLRRAYTSEADEDDDDRWPPQQVIAYWAGRWRTERGEDYPDLHRTTTTEISYVRQLLDWATSHEPQWATFADDIRRARTTAENLVSAGRRSDKSRVVCDRDHCDRHPRLIRTYSPRFLTGWTCTTCGEHTPAEYRCTDHHHAAVPSAQPCTRPTGPKGGRTPCASPLAVMTTEPTVCLNVRCPSFDPPDEVYASDPTHDGWKCPSCKHRYAPKEFQRAHARMLLRPEAERWVRLPEAIATLKAQARGLRTIRRWLAPQRELVDRCLECAAIHPHQEYPACPAEVVQHRGEEPVICGGILEPRWHGNAEAVVEGYCDPTTHTTWLWWPDLWRLHHATRVTTREKGMMSA